MIHRFLLILGFCTIFGSAAHAGQDVWIDADPACGLGATQDVDDCWAIVAAVRSSHLNVIGISTVFGNVDVDQATTLTRTLISSLSAHEPALAVPPVYSGAGESITRNPPYPSAVRELESALTQGPLTILALGPPTNVALLLKKRPDLAYRIEAIVAVAGQRPGQVFKVGDTPFLHFHDFNVRKDVDAFDIVLRSGIPVHLVPFEVGRLTTVSRADLNSMDSNGPLDRWIAKRSVAWLEFWEDTLGATGFSPFDTAAVAYLVQPRLFTCKAMPAKIIRRRGMFTVRDTLEVSSSITDGYAVTYCHGISRSLRQSLADFVSQPDRITWRNSLRP